MPIYNCGNGVYTQLQRHCLQPLIYIMQMYTQNHTQLGKGKTFRSATHSGGVREGGKKGGGVWGGGGGGKGRGGGVQEQ